MKLNSARISQAAAQTIDADLEPVKRTAVKAFTPSEFKRALETRRILCGPCAEEHDKDRILLGYSYKLQTCQSCGTAVEVGVVVQELKSKAGSF